MALDNLEGIREYRDRVEDVLAAEGPKAVIALGNGTMLTLLDTLFEEITRLQMKLNTGKENRMESVKVIPLHQRRRVKHDPRLMDSEPGTLATLPRGYAGTDGPDLVGSD